MKTKKREIYKWCFFSALAAGVVYLAILIVNRIAPFGNGTIISCDAIFQYVPFLSEFSQRIHEGQSLLYSWTSGGGQNYFGLICYYLLNPYNFVSFFFKSENMTEAYALIVLLNTMTISFTMSYFLQKKFNRSDVSIIVFSLLYIFSGFYIAYYYNTMWLMALICLPLIALGIEKIANGGKAWTYLISLALCIISNFYLGYMICIFAVLYFFVCLFSQDINKREQEGRVKLSSVMAKFAGGSLIAGGISAITLIPILYSLSNAYVKNSWLDDVTVFFNALEFMRVQLPGVIPNTILMTADTYPPVALGSFALLLIPMYAFVKNISKNEKIAHIVLVIIFLVSFEVPTIYYLWHGMSAPAGLPYRFAFLYLFTLVILAYKVFTNIKEIKKPVIVIPVALIATAYIYSFITVFENYGIQLIVGAITATISLILIILLMKLKENRRQLISVIALVVVAVEIVATTTDAYGGVKKDWLYSGYQNAQDVKEIISNDTDDFYRMEYSEYKDLIMKDNDSYASNAASLYGYNGISGFSSLIDTEYALMQFDMGCSGNLGNTYSYATQTPIYNALFNVNYVVDNGSILSSSPYYTKIGETDETGVYKAQYSNYFATLSDPGVKDWDGYNSNPLLAQSTLWESITGVGNTITSIEPSSLTLNNCTIVSQQEAKAADDDAEILNKNSLDHSEEMTVYELLDTIKGYYAYKINDPDYSLSFTITPEKTQNLFLIVQSGVVDNVTVTKTDSNYNNSFSFFSKRIIDIGMCNAGETVTVTFYPSKSYDGKNLTQDNVLDDSLLFCIGGFDDEAFKQSISELDKNGSFELTSFSDTDITADVKVNKASTCIVPIPYEEGWTVYVNGEAVELFEHSSHMLMFDLDRGDYQIEMKYTPQGLKEGVFVSVAMVLVLLLVVLLSYVFKQKNEFLNEEEQKKVKPDTNDKSQVNSEAGSKAEPAPEDTEGKEE